MLVVMGTVAILASLLVPGLFYAKLRATVTTCTGNFRQWGIAAAVYTSDDSRGRLPSFTLPVINSQLSTYLSLEPWFVALPMITNMAPSGVTPKMWFCPTRKGWSDVDEYFRSRNHGASIGSAMDLHNYYAQLVKASIAGPDMCWWVPRGLEGSTNDYPDPKVVISRTPEPWPMTMEDAASAIKPIASDWTVSGWDKDRKVPVSPGGGHSFGGRLRSSNAAFADGHVELRPSSAIEWQIVSDPGDHAVLY